ncbi:MAG TPA: hypothetical protein VF755_06500 [Catenuloplanes sp.]
MPGRAGARRHGDRGSARVRLLTGAAVLSATVLVVIAVRAGDQGSAGDPTVGAVVRVGVRDGDSIPDYLSSTRRELASLVAVAPSAAPGPDPYALVTFAAYRTPDQLAPALDGVTVAAVYARVPTPRVQTQIVRIPAIRVPADVAAGMLDAAARKDREAADYRRLSAALTGDGAEQRRRRDLYDSGAAVAAAEATAYRQRCGCVYAAVVRAPAAALDRIATRPEVRTVDPAPEVQRLDRAVFVPPLPEQVDVVRPPADDGSPGTGPSSDFAGVRSPSATAGR